MWLAVRSGGKKRKGICPQSQGMEEVKEEAVTADEEEVLKSQSRGS